LLHGWPRSAIEFHGNFFLLPPPTFSSTGGHGIIFLSNPSLPTLAGYKFLSLVFPFQRLLSTLLWAYRITLWQVFTPHRDEPFRVWLLYCLVSLSTANGGGPGGCHQDRGPFFLKTSFPPPPTGRGRDEYGLLFPSFLFHELESTIGLSPKLPDARRLLKVHLKLVTPSVTWTRTFPIFFPLTSGSISQHGDILSANFPVVNLPSA